MGKWLRPPVHGLTEVVPSVVKLLALGIAMGGGFPLGLAGQEGPSDARRSPVELRLGTLGFGAGDTNCAPAYALAGGVSLRSRGQTFVQGSLDLLGAGDPRCTFPPHLTRYQGADVFISGTPRLRFSLRTGAWVGRGLEMGGLLFEPALGAGFTRVRTLYLSGFDQKRRTWQPWTAARLTVRGQRSGIGARIEVGRNRLPKRYYVPGPVPSRGEPFHSFHAWNTITEFGIAVRPSRPRSRFSPRRYERAGPA